MCLLFIIFISPSVFVETKFSPYLAYITVNLPSVLLLIYNPLSKQLILLVVKKPDAPFEPSCAKDHVKLKDMIQVSVRFSNIEANTMNEQMGSSF